MFRNNSEEITTQGTTTVITIVLYKKQQQKNPQQHTDRASSFNYPALISCHITLIHKKAELQSPALQSDAAEYKKQLNELQYDPPPSPPPTPPNKAGRLQISALIE